MCSRRGNSFATTFRTWFWVNFIDLKKKGVLQQDVLSVDQKGSKKAASPVFLRVNKQMGQQGVDLSEYNAIFCCLRINGGIIGKPLGGGIGGGLF